MDKDQEVIKAVSSISPEEAKSFLLKSGTPRLKAQIENGVVNPIELARAIGIKPQMVYNYIRNGKLLVRSSLETQKMVIPLDSALDFVSRRMDKDVAKKVKIQKELRGE